MKLKLTAADFRQKSRFRAKSQARPFPAIQPDCLTVIGGASPSAPLDQRIPKSANGVLQSADYTLRVAGDLVGQTFIFQFDLLHGANGLIR